MSIKAKVIVGYLAIALLTAIYLANWGANAYRGFAYNLGSALIWPAIIFPGVGQFIGALLLVAIIAFVVFS